MKSLVSLCLSLLAAVGASGQALRMNPGFQAKSIPANDDGSSPLEPLGFTINFFGRLRSSVYVNNNGNVTFDAPLPTYTPFGLEKTQREIVAVFFADVDTRGTGSNLVTYGQDVIDGKRAFGVNYFNVGYYNQHSDKLNTFQLVLIDRSDIGPGDFDIEFNYGRIAWETGDASGGVGGYGGVAAAIGWSNGSGEPGTSYELAGSLLPGSFLDSSPRSVVRGRMNSSIAGRWVFRARDGMISPGLSITTGCPLPNTFTGVPLRIQFAAAGEAPPFRWSMLADPGMTLPFAMNAAGLLTGTISSPGTYHFTVSVTARGEDGDVTAAKRCSITAEPPVVSVKSACPLPEAVAGAAYAQQLEAAGGTGPFAWKVEGRLPPGLTLSSAGRLSGVPASSGVYQFQLQVSSSDEGAAPGFKQCSLIVRPSAPEPAIAGCPAEFGTVGVPYEQTLGASGGRPPYLWSADGQLPAGLSLSPDGELRGVPSVAASYRFSLRAADSLGRTAARTCAVTIGAPVVRLLSECPLPPASAGVAYSHALRAEGGSGAYSWSLAGSLPAGLRLSRDGVIRGTPLAAGPAQFRLVVTDSQGYQAGAPCSLTVTRPSFAVTSCPLPPGIAGTRYESQARAVGGEGPYLWSYAGALPAGLALSPAGVFYGVPEQPGAFDFVLRAIDAGGAAASQSCLIRIEPALPKVLTQCPAPNAEVGASYRFQFEAAGGVGPYQWFTADELPAGLSLSPQGLLSGVARLAGRSSFEVRGTDALGRNFSTICSLAVELPRIPEIRLSAIPQVLAPATSNIPTGVELGAAYSLPIQGLARLQVTPNTGHSEAEANRADPMVRFVNGQQFIRFTIPAGERRASLPIVSSGTVASTVSFSVSQLEISGNRLAAAPPPRTFAVDRLPPVITSACYNQRPEGIELLVSGYTTTRQLDEAELTFPSGVVRHNIAGAAGEYFLNPVSVRTGGAFTLTLPLAPETAGSVPTALRLSNSAGHSASRTLSRCP